MPGSGDGPCTAQRNTPRNEKQPDCNVVHLTQGWGLCSKDGGGAALSLGPFRGTQGPQTWDSGADGQHPTAALVPTHQGRPRKYEIVGLAVVEGGGGGGESSHESCRGASIHASPEYRVLPGAPQELQIHIDFRHVVSHSGTNRAGSSSCHSQLLHTQQAPKIKH